MGNLKGRCTHWVMASMVDAFSLRGEGELEEVDESCNAKRTKEAKRRVQKSEKRRRANELKPTPYVDPSLQRLLNGDPSALEEQRLRNEQIRMSS